MFIKLRWILFIWWNLFIMTATPFWFWGWFIWIPCLCIYIRLSHAYTWHLVSPWSYGADGTCTYTFEQRLGWKFKKIGEGIEKEPWKIITG
jgi:hypothetical protein